MEILTFKEAAEFLKIKPSYLYELVREGIIPYRQTARGCQITFSREALENWWLESHHPLPLKLRINKLKLIRSIAVKAPYRK